MNRLFLGSVVVSLSLGRFASSPAQTIRFQPVDATHVRLRLDGREKWIVESMGFSFTRSQSPDVVVVVAMPGQSTVKTPDTSTTTLDFALSIGRVGTSAPPLGFHVNGAAIWSSITSDQTLRIEPVDTTHARLHLVGRENWIVESTEFSVVPAADSVHVIAAPGPNAVTVFVTPLGAVRIQSANSSRR